MPTCSDIGEGNPPASPPNYMNIITTCLSTPPPFILTHRNTHTHTINQLCDTPADLATSQHTHSPP